MNSEFALECLNDGKIDYLKDALMENLYEKSLKNPESKRRAYTKRFISYRNTKDFCPMSKKEQTKPCKISYDIYDGVSFLHHSGIALVNDGYLDGIDIADEMFNPSKDGDYYNVGSLLKNTLNNTNYEGYVNINKAIVQAKAKGYSITSRGCSKIGKYATKIDAGYFNLNLLDLLYGLIDDGNPYCKVRYQKGNWKSMIVLQNDVGYVAICPFNIESATQNGEAKEVIEAEVFDTIPKEW